MLIKVPKYKHPANFASFKLLNDDAREEYTTFCLITGLLDENILNAILSFLYVFLGEIVSFINVISFFSILS